MKKLKVLEIISTNMIWKVTILNNKVGLIQSKYNDI